MEYKILENIYILQLRDIYCVERQIVIVLSKMVKLSHNEDLKVVLYAHLEQTRIQVLRIEEIFKDLSVDVRGGNCNAIEKFIEEVKKMVEENDNADVIDTCIISGFQKIEHYKIASYGSLITYAKALGNRRVVEVLQLSMDAAYEIDNKLDKLSEEMVTLSIKADH